MNDELEETCNFKFRALQWNFPWGGMKKTTEYFCRYSWRPGRDSNPKPLEYGEATTFGLEPLLAPLCSLSYVEMFGSEAIETDFINTNLVPNCKKYG